MYETGSNPYDYDIIESILEAAGIHVENSYHEASINNIIPVKYSNKSPIALDFSVMDDYTPLEISMYVNTPDASYHNLYMYEPYVNVTRSSL